MFLSQKLHLKRDGLQKLYNLLEGKILHLRKAKIIETHASVIFSLDKQIEEAEAERDKVAQELDEIEQQLGQEN